VGTAIAASHDLPPHLKYCHNGGMRFAFHHGVGLPGSVKAIMAPSRRPPEIAPFAGKMLQRSGGPCLWVRRWARLPFFRWQRRASTATTVASPSATSQTAAPAQIAGAQWEWSGVVITEVMAAHCGTPKMQICRKNELRRRGPNAFGGADGVECLASRRFSSVGATRKGHGRKSLSRFCGLVRMKKALLGAILFEGKSSLFFGGQL
jgi:hypothetical protein